MLDQNLLSVLPGTLWDLGFLRVLRLANNRLAVPPDRFAEMRALVLAVSYQGLVVEVEGIMPLRRRGFSISKDGLFTFETVNCYVRLVGELRRKRNRNQSY